MKTPRKYPGYPTKNISNKNREIIWIIRFFSRKMKNKSIDHLNLAISSVTRNSLDSDPEILFWKWTTCLWLSFSKCNMSLVRHPGSKSQVDLSNFAREIQPTSWTLVVDLPLFNVKCVELTPKIAILQKKDTHFFQHSSFSVLHSFVEKSRVRGRLKNKILYSLYLLKVWFIDWSPSNSPHLEKSSYSPHIRGSTGPTLWCPRYGVNVAFSFGSGSLRLGDLGGWAFNRECWLVANELKMVCLVGRFLVNQDHQTKPIH